MSADSDIAVVWTKPSDWDVDFENPKKGLFGKESFEALFALADGSTGKYLKDVDKAKLKGMLTRDGGETP